MKLQTNIKLDNFTYTYKFQSETEMRDYVRRETLNKIADELMYYVEFTEENRFENVEISSIVHVIRDQDFKMIINTLKDLKINADSKSEQLINNIFDKLTN